MPDANQVCTLGDVSLVLRDVVWQEMPEKNRKFTRWPASPAHLQKDLMAFERGVPAFIQFGQGKHEGQLQIMICTPAYFFMAVPSQQGDAYLVPTLKPLGLTQHDSLTRRTVLLKARRWLVHTEFGTVPKGSQNFAARILEAWQTLQTESRAETPPAYRLSENHERYLNLVSELIEVTRQITRDKAALEKPVSYRAVEAVGEARYSTRDIYAFQLAAHSPRPAQGDMLCLREAPEIYGRVFSLEGQKLIIKFEGPVDKAAIPDQGVFEQKASLKPFDIQQEAVDIIRTGDARNPHLLEVLADCHYQSYYYPAPIHPSIELNPAQEEAFKRALTVTDMLLVLGPPGTGKTKTITEVVRQLGQEGRRVLVTAKSNKAVDNILERLPGGLTCVRLGHEDRVSEYARNLLIEAQARTLQASILQRTEATAGALENFARYKDELSRRVQTLATLAAELEANEARSRDARQDLEETERHIKSQYGKSLERTRAAMQKYAASIHKAGDSQKRLEQQFHEVSSAGEKLFPLNLFGRLRGFLLSKQIASCVEKQREDQSAYDAEARAYAKASKELRSALHSPEFRRLEQQVRDADQALQEGQRSAAELITHLDGLVIGLAGGRPAINSISATSVRSYVTWVSNTIPRLESRGALLAEWRTLLKTRSEELFPLLIRFSDVVGATCIGIATDPNFKTVDFDLVIADEAGQIGLTDLLVPLIRAKRAMLVGDHHQLPPFVESEVEAWLKARDAAVSKTGPEAEAQALPDLDWLEDDETGLNGAVKAMLTKSVFELLFPSADPAHLVRFREQFRMPQAVADFASRCFYEGLLTTGREEKLYGSPHHDPIFRKPIAFIDTSSLSPSRRGESDPGKAKSDQEAWGMTGYVNHAEAELIAAIVAAYEQRGLAWVVIVPYRAQANLIRKQISRRLQWEPGAGLDERVATVDSFQGGECERVIYGFTRSNPERQVGFLRELRRLNVAITRAKEQLVLVGDTQTLAQARNTPFREMMQMLVKHVQQNGEMFSYTGAQERLTQAAQETTRR